jgi:hypothetical protein
VPVVWPNRAPPNGWCRLPFGCKSENRELRLTHMVFKARPLFVPGCFFGETNSKVMPLMVDNNITIKALFVIVKAGLTKKNKSHTT